MVAEAIKQLEKKAGFLKPDQYRRKKIHQNITYPNILHVFYKFYEFIRQKTKQIKPNVVHFTETDTFYCNFIEQI